MQTGKKKQFIPYDGIYVYFRYDDNATVMVIANNNDTSRKVKTDRFVEVLAPFTKGKDVTSGKNFDITNSVEIPGKTVLLLELK